MKIIVGVNNLAKELKLSRYTISRYIRQGMPCNKINSRTTVFNTDEVEKWLLTKKE